MGRLRGFVVLRAGIRAGIRAGVTAGITVGVTVGLLSGCTGAGPSSASTLSAESQAQGAGDSCATADQRLYQELAQLVPAVKDATPRPLPGGAYCPKGGRGVEVDVGDGRASGVLRVLYSPPGTVGGGSNVQTSAGSMSTTTVSTRGGGSLSLTTKSAGRGAAPFEDQLDDLADQLARRN